MAHNCSISVEEKKAEEIAAEEAGAALAGQNVELLDDSENTRTVIANMDGSSDYLRY